MAAEVVAGVAMAEAAAVAGVVAVSAMLIIRTGVASLACRAEISATARWDGRLMKA